MVSKHRIVFPNQRSEWSNDRLWQRLRREELTWQGAHPREKWGLKLIFEGEAEKTLAKVEKPKTMEAEWDKKVEAVSRDSRRSIHREESKFKSHGPIWPQDTHCREWLKPKQLYLINTIASAASYFLRASLPL